MGISKNPGINDSLYRAIGFVLVILISYLALHHLVDGGLHPASVSSSSSAASSAPSTDTYTTLSPAKVPSKTPECSQTIAFDAQGVPNPLTCSDGDINVLAWQSLATLEPTLMIQSYDTTVDQAQSAICADVNATLSDANTKNSIVVEDAVYQITHLYYGWNFGSDPTAALTNGTCG